MDLEKKIGFFTLRIWGLILNLISNFIALYGISGYLRGESGPLLMVVGLAATVIVILILSKPQK